MLMDASKLITNEHKINIKLAAHNNATYNRNQNSKRHQRQFSGILMHNTIASIVWQPKPPSPLGDPVAG